MSELTYSNPTTSRTIENWPHGSMRTTAMFYVETDPKRGQRACRRTVNPKNGTLSAPKKLTFSARQRIVDGSDGKTYILSESSHYGFVGVMQSNMQFQQEAIFPNNDRYPALIALLNQEEPG